MYRRTITPDTVVEAFTSVHVPHDVDYVSIDIDSVDLWVFQGIIRSHRFRPRVISVEFNQVCGGVKDHIHTQI